MNYVDYVISIGLGGFLLFKLSNKVLLKTFFSKQYK
jgi:hypothetical protein